MGEETSASDRRGAYRVPLPPRSPYRLELENHAGVRAEAKLLDVSIAGLRVCLERAVQLPCRRGDVLEARLRLNSLPEPIELETAVASHSTDAQGKVYLGLRLGDTKLLERQLPQRYYALFNRRRCDRVSGAHLEGDARVELQLGAHRAFTRSAAAELRDISPQGMRAEADAAFDDLLGADCQLLAEVRLPQLAMPLQIPASVRTRQRDRFRVQYGLMFDPASDGPDPRVTIAAALRRGPAGADAGA